MTKRTQSVDFRSTGLQENRQAIGAPSTTAAMKALGSVLYAVRIDVLIKIGHTSDLAMRLRTLRYRQGARYMQLLAVQFGTLADERAIHERLKPHLARGREYYHPTPEVLAIVNDMRADLGMDATVMVPSSPRVRALQEKSGITPG